MGGEKKVRCDVMDRWSSKRAREEEVVDKSMADARKVVDGERAAKALPDPVEEPRVDDIMLDIDGDDLIFSEDNFPSLPDFPCLSSPSATPSPSAANTVLSSCSSASSSSSSSSSEWSFLQVPDDASVADMQPPRAVAEVPSVVDDIMMLSPPPSLMLDHHQSSEFSDVGLDILGDIDLFDLSVDPWDPSSLLIHPDEVGLAVGDGGVADHEARKLCHGGEDGCGGEGGVQQPQEESSSEDLARIFLEWLRNNKDSISPQDLRSIKLKRATIESAARRLGRNTQGRSQLLKLILTWVQNYHLQRKRQLQQQPAAAAPFSYENHQHRQCPIAPQLDYNYAAAAADSNFTPRCNSWMPYSMDPSAAGAASHPALVTAYGGDMVYPGAVAPPYPYHHGTSSVVVNSQPFSPTADFVDPAATGAPWPPTQLAPALAPQFMVPPPQYPGGGFAANQFLGHTMYHQGGGQRLAGVDSATKEARKKRMARQRRFSSLHHHRNHNQQQQHSHHPAIGDAAEAMANGATHPSARGWAFWANMTSSTPHMSDAHISSSMQQAAAPPPAAQQQQSSRSRLPSSASASEKRQGWKGEKNLKFLLQKVLKQSDVGSLGRIVLPKKEAETHLPELDARDGISIPMEDIGTSQVWNMRYRFWPNNKSRMYLLENTGDFVRSNGLQEGDFIVIYSDVKCGKYMIRGVKVRQPVESRPPAQAASGRNNGVAGGSNKAHQRRANGLEKTSAAGAPRPKGSSRMREETENEEDA